MRTVVAFGGEFRELSRFSTALVSARKGGVDLVLGGEIFTAALPGSRKTTSFLNGCFGETTVFSCRDLESSN